MQGCRAGRSRARTRPRVARAPLGRRSASGTTRRGRERPGRRGPALKGCRPRCAQPTGGNGGELGNRNHNPKTSPKRCDGVHQFTC
eukprot:4659124-Prymnesium_polylepis.1